jgi:hypothetical protein
MPNWVFNNLHLEGSAEDLQKVKAQLNAPYTRNFSGGEEVVYSNPVISFLNIVRPPEDKMDEYEGVHGFADGKKQGEGEFNWYNFNNRAWGTKWDVAVSDGQTYSETQLNEEEGHLHYAFQTAWSPPLAVIEALALQHPELEITLNYEEEQGWGGEIYWDKTGSSVVNEYDIPESHQDFIDRDNEGGCVCSYEDDKSEWYEDCPNNAKPIEIYAKRDVMQVTK